MSTNNNLKDSFSGALAAVISAFVVYPFEVLRVRRQIELSISNAISWSDIFSRALALRLTHTAVTSLIYYGFYESFKKLSCFDYSKYSKTGGNSSNGKWKFLSNFLSANIAGILSSNHKILGMMPHPERFLDIYERDHIMSKMLKFI